MLKIKYKKSLATLTALAISATVFSPFAQAHAAEDKTIKEVSFPVKVQQTELQKIAQAKKLAETNEPIASTMGIKRKAIQGLIEALDGSIDWVVDILKDYKIMDGNVARSFKRNKGVISKNLKKWMNAPDIIIDTVKKKLPGELKRAGVTKGVAENITTGVVFLLRVADIFFV
ncbi:hypothetical protein ABE159_11165 [Bacillus licheniformis]